MLVSEAFSPSIFCQKLFRRLSAAREYLPGIGKLPSSVPLSHHPDSSKRSKSDVSFDFILLYYRGRWNEAPKLWAGIGNWTLFAQASGSSSFTCSLSSYLSLSPRRLKLEQIELFSSLRFPNFRFIFIVRLKVRITKDRFWLTLFEEMEKEGDRASEQTNYYKSIFFSIQREFGAIWAEKCAYRSFSKLPIENSLNAHLLFANYCFPLFPGEGAVSRKFAFFWTSK